VSSICSFQNSVLMNKDRKSYGIDISKDVFDVYNDTKGHCQLNNVRIKLLARAFLVIKRGTPYVEIKQFAA